MGDAEVVGRLLVVDDNEMNRDMLTRRLSRRGYDVDAAADGHDALRRLEDDGWDLVLLDIMMPGLSGLEVLDEIRRTRSKADLPVIMATAKDQSEDIVDALRRGANDYVTKPLDFAVVRARVRTQLDLKRAVTEVQTLAHKLEQRNQFIRSTFGRYLSDDVVSELLDSPDGTRLGGERRTITILVADLRGFTALSERLEPELVVTVLNRFLERMIDIVLQYGGTVHEIMGDGLLVFFGAPTSAPDDTERAVACALTMQRAIPELNHENCAVAIPELEMGIGVGTGDVVVGNIGCERRSKYGAVGRHINLTFRIESCSVGGQVLVCPNTFAKLADRLEVAGTEAIQVKGLREPLQLADVCGLTGTYAVALDAAASSTAPPLETELPATVWRLEGKKVSPQPIAARVQRLSTSGAILACSEPIPTLSDLKIEIELGSGERLEELYGKVTESDQATGDEHTVRFTSLTPQVRDRIARLASA
jgi:class 3 adenylate cyclase